VSGTFTTPAPWGGLWGVDAFAERQPFTSDIVPASHRRGAHLSVSEWVAPRVRASIRGGVERWDGVDTFGVLSGGLRLLSIDERFESRIELSGWKAGSSFGTMDVGATVRSTPERRGQVFVGRAGLGFASVEAPADIWFAGDTGPARAVLLRAHPLMTDGEMRVDQIGRQILYTSDETQRWWPVKTGVRLGAAAFVDVVKIDRRPESRARTDVDVGIGARLAVPGVSGAVRVDVAKGLRDGATTLSFVYEP
jgi:hypothetical protein